MNILFLAFEGEANSMGQLAKRFKAKGHRVFVASCDHFTVTHGRGETFDYYRSLGLQESEYANLDSVYRELNRCPEDLPDREVDWEFLRRYERSYCGRFTLLELVAMDPLMSGAYHHRNIYYRPANKALLYKCLELHLKWLEGILQSLECGAVISMNFQYFVKAAAFSMSEALKIPFLMISTSRIQDLHLIYDNFSFGTPQNVVAEMRRLQASSDSCNDAVEYIGKLKVEKKPAYSKFEATLQQIHRRLSLRFRLGELWRYFYRYPRKAIFFDKHYRGLLKTNYFLPSYFSILRIMLVSMWRNIEYFRHPELTRHDLPPGPFVFFPLHLIPENSVLTLSPTFDEMECLFQLSKALPVDWKVVVKINPNMIADFDTHPNRYYLEMSQLPNVQFVHPQVASATVIEKAAAVACISGTALLEGAVFDKPGFRWGQTEFDSVNIVSPFEAGRLQQQLNRRGDNNVRYYIQACFNLGMRLNEAVVNRSLNQRLDATQQAEYEVQISSLEDALTSWLQARVPRPERSS